MHLPRGSNRILTSFVVVILAGVTIIGLRPGLSQGFTGDGRMIIVSMGDSFAAGDGAPDMPSTFSSAAFWQDAECFRSNKAGPAQAARVFTQQYPGTVFLHVACSGAEIDNGLLQPQSGMHKAAQIDQVRDFMATFRDPSARIDALVISVGGNDAGFQNVVTQCLVDNPWYPPAFPVVAGKYPLPFRPPFDSIQFLPNQFTPQRADCNNDQALRGDVDARLAALDAKYDRLAAAIRGKLNVANVYLTEYPDPSHKRSGVYCASEPFSDPFRNLSQAEISWADQSVRVQINQKVAAAAQRHAADGWHLIGGYSPLFANHGYCSDAPWFNTATASVLTQADASRPEAAAAGAMHPNEAGYTVYRDQIVNNLIRLYTSPPAPSKVRFLAAYPSGVSLAWNDNSPNEAYFGVSYRSLGTAAWTLVTVPANTPPDAWAMIGSLTGSTTYDFKVQACNNFGCSGFTNVMQATTLAAVPAAPTNLQATALGSTSIQLIWTDNATTETKFIVRYRVRILAHHIPGPGDPDPIGPVPIYVWSVYSRFVTLPANTTQYQLQGLDSDTEHMIWVTACNGATTSYCSTESNSVTVKTLP